MGFTVKYFLRDFRGSNVHQNFTITLQACGKDKNKLSALLSEIDAEKRSLKSLLSRLSSEPERIYGRGRERQVKIRKMKDKLSFLTEEREAVRERLGAMKMDAKALNRATNSRSIDFAHAFIAAAERLLPDEMFLELESRAADILSSE